jgi:hypothetical protein
MVDLSELMEVYASLSPALCSKQQRGEDSLYVVAEYLLISLLPKDQRFG